MLQMPALRVLWLALVSLYDETIALVVGNLLWLALNLPVFLLLAGVALPFADPGNVAWVLVGFVLLAALFALNSLIGLNLPPFGR